MKTIITNLFLISALIACKETPKNADKIDVMRTSEISDTQVLEKLDKDKTDYLLKMVPENWLNLDSVERKIAISVYKLLAKGKPVSRDELASSVQLPGKVISEMLDSWPGIFFNKQKEIVGFWGLGIQKVSPYDFTVNGVKTHTWCAWDAVFIPPLLGEQADVIAECPITKEKIQLTVYADGSVESKNPGVVVSFIDPDAAKMMDNVIENFCHYIYFFSSEEAGRKWVANNEGTYLLSLEDTQFLSSRKNQVQFGMN